MVVLSESEEAAKVKLMDRTVDEPSVTFLSPFSLARRGRRALAASEHRPPVGAEPVRPAKTGREASAVGAERAPPQVDREGPAHVANGSGQETHAAGRRSCRNETNRAPGGALLPAGTSATLLCSDQRAAATLGPRNPRWGEIPRARRVSNFAINPLTRSASAGRTRASWPSQR